MTEITVLIGLLTDFINGIISNKIQDSVMSAKKKCGWKKLFTSTGQSFIENKDDEQKFAKSLSDIFSKKNMTKIAKRLKNQNGLDLVEVLQKELYKLMLDYEIPPFEAKQYIFDFTKNVIAYLKEKDSNRYLEVFLSQWEKEDKEEHHRIIELINLNNDKLSGLDDKKTKLYSIQEIDAEIRRDSIFEELSLDFFEIDDEQFEIQFQGAIGNNKIFVIGKSREEALYRILHMLGEKYPAKAVFVVKREDDWDKLRKEEMMDCILIPFFFAESIVPIANNTNIFIYGEDEPCYEKKKLILRRRTKKNIVSALEKIGIAPREAYSMVEKTHGLFVPLKKKLFDIAVHEKPEWVKKQTDTVIAALLCGKWTEAEGDKLVFSELAGKDYEECKKELMSYTYGENPYIVEKKGYIERGIQLASIENAWEEVDSYIRSETWNKFVDLLYEVLIESEPIFEYPFEKHFEASVYADKPGWSQTLKRGMLRSLVMRAYYRGHEDLQKQVDEVVEKVLNTINTKERWGYIAQYMPDLCEASPNAVLKRLEDELLIPTGLVDLFGVDDGDYLTGRHYYVNILWAVEQLIQQKKYVKRAVDWLWKMNSYSIDYSISNSPKNILQTIFCARINLCAFSVDEKIKMAQHAVENYNGAWDVIALALPSGNSSICATLNTPKYRNIDDPDTVDTSDMNKTYIQYLNICIENMDGCVERWTKILDSLNWYDETIQDEVMRVLCDSCEQMKDEAAIQIKNKIRHIIHLNRMYSESDWSIEESKIKKYEKVLETITVKNLLYDYLYLITDRYNFPVLKPVPHGKDENNYDYMKQNDKLRDEEIMSQFASFKEKKLPIEEFVDLALQVKNNFLGEVLAKYYCEGIYNEQILAVLLEKDNKGIQVCDYIRYFVYNGNVAINLKSVVDKVRQTVENDDLIADIISLELIEDKSKAMIANESDSIKKEYWTKFHGRRISDNAVNNTFTWALEECYNFGNIDTYLELLFDLKDKLSDVEVYHSMLRISDMRSSINSSMTEYYLKETLNIIQKVFMADSEKCSDIAMLEWSCRNILEWEQMKCMQYMMKKNPKIYADLVRLIYKSSDDVDVVDEEKSKIASKLYVGFEKAKFCPTETNGKVKYEELRQWIEDFKSLLLEQKQIDLFEHFVGKLLAYSPVGKDGIAPCEAVRKIIEDYRNDSLKKSYIIAEENKRGVHMIDAGESEIRLYEKYKLNAEQLQAEGYSYTAEIYFELSDSYKNQADNERRRAEDEW